MRYQIEPRSQNGARAIVLGARSGTGNIGDETAARFALSGYQVWGDDCAVGDGSRPPGGNLPNDDVARQFGYNVTDKGRYQRFEVPAWDWFFRVHAHALVVTLGATYKGHFAEIDEAEISRIMNANLLLPLQAVRRFVNAREQRRLDDSRQNIEWDEQEVAKIILVGSYAHNHPFTNGTLYCAAKAGLDMAARTLGWELTDKGYRVHVVHPYHVQGTPMWSQVEQDVMKSKGMTWEEADAYNRKDLKMPDLLTAKEVAKVIYEVANNKAWDWVTGPVELYGGSR